MLNRFYLHSWLWSASHHPHSLSGCRRETSVVFLCTNNCSLPTTLPLLSSRHQEIRITTLPKLYVSQTWREICNFRGRTLSQPPPGWHPCPFTCEMGAWMSTRPVVRSGKLRPCFRLLLTAICCYLLQAAIHCCVHLKSKQPLGNDPHVNLHQVYDLLALLY